ncbi:hypothetical protein MKW98_008926 [Papaver atlanticum]|uniref:Uncharacterized protein n=1 Tax=Papaver atlanticum TaxID=357466 RepID=A0AAD4S2E4_9MAGN|nr:hypothetical protein MKW98_008926 [Papaver atlanticum]
MQCLKNFKESIHVFDDEVVTLKDNSVIYAAGNTQLDNKVVSKDNQNDKLAKLKFVNNCFFSQTDRDGDKPENNFEDRYEDLLESDDEGNGLKDGSQANGPGCNLGPSLYEKMYVEELQNAEEEEFFFLMMIKFQRP